MTQMKFNVVTLSHQHYGGEPLSDLPEKEINLAEMNEALLEISFAINSHLELPVILEQVVAFTCKNLGFCDGSILLWDGRLRQFKSGVSSTQVGDAVVKRVRKKNGASSWVVREQRSLVVSDVAYDPFVANKMIPENQIKAYAGIPILNEGRSLGVLYALSQETYPFSKLEIDILEKLASLLATAIKNAQLVESLKELNDFKTNMMRLAVHDLIQPLSLMMGFCDLMSDEMAPFTPEQAKRMAAIKRSQCQMDELINGIIKYEKFSVNESEIEHESFNINDLAESVVMFLKDVAAEKSQSLRFESDLAAPYFFGDVFLLHEALSNLVLNGIKYTPEYGQVVVKTSQIDDVYLLTVEDTGPGIEPDQLEQIFNPFIRLKTEQTEKGLGLGLSLVKQIAEHHRGYAFVESVVGKGSRFHIQIPCNSNDRVKSGVESEQEELDSLAMSLVCAI